jgi:hypothetical protein
MVVSPIGIPTFKGILGYACDMSKRKKRKKKKRRGKE